MESMSPRNDPMKAQEDLTELLQGADRGSSATGLEEKTDTVDQDLAGYNEEEQAMIRSTRILESQTLTSVQNTLNLVNSSVGVAQQTANALAEHEHKIESINNELTYLDEETTRSNKLLNSVDYYSWV